MDRRWETAEPVSDEFRARFPELHPVAIQLLGNRGLETQEQVDEFLLPDYGHDLHDPFLFREMQAACERIFLAIEKQERVVV
ncbi:TPA: single-stranded-DNA-specific exonuclease RecJ, partial [Candidatus Uhrbacteria bacterium]|nr:single-stranded-DNA-specific exonuclease RecJ [Candidatus Uhrbacteria bacterium]